MPQLSWGFWVADLKTPESKAEFEDWWIIAEFLL